MSQITTPISGQSYCLLLGILDSASRGKAAASGKGTGRLRPPNLQASAEEHIVIYSNDALQRTFSGEATAQWASFCASEVLES